MTAEEIDAFWTAARHQTRTNPVPGYLGTYSAEALAPPAWAFGATPEHAEELLALVLAGTKTATSSALWDFEHDGEPMPQVGDLAIILDGEERPRALIEIVRVDVVPFDEVDAEHAHLEGEGDRSYEYWRDVHQRYFDLHSTNGRGFSPSMPVVLERFRLLYPR
ncbi:ASCH domain-containing protein [Aeromicrobium sp. CFBP 8757]|uniref:ASCH domain-containing protein n=1 Tax=Aeromicrobium sp. CFBP 8757 TaxID=2775288 RepID=UPI0017868C6D|nr:ASCH domain-containing protein [Aeromicrobium sp. CFBP 8757]MBD8606688.1 ASCH domain-containing protein [Aeromicrobium sp. CFBP 8757]